MSVPKKNSKNERYTYADYLTWDDDVRYELIDGVAYLLASPSRKHQDISRELLLSIGNHLKGKSCMVYHAPFDVRLDADTVLQPDLLVVCDKSKLDGKACLGAPDLVIEILSASTVQRDRVSKYHKYLQAGVREYWIVEPEGRVVDVFTLEDGKYIHYAYSDSDVISSHVLEGCDVNLAEVFDKGEDN